MESRIAFLRSRVPCRGISKSGMVGFGIGKGAATISGTDCEECARNERAVSQM